MNPLDPHAGRRCPWANPNNPRYLAYHDQEWGVPEHDEQRLFELLTLEGAQAGLSWETVLNKREHYRTAFEGFDPARVAGYTEQQTEQLLTNPGIVRHRLKIQSTVGNARAWLRVQDEQGSFDAYLWAFVDGRPIQNHWATLSEVPAHTELSDRISRDLKKRGFKFVGSTIIYAFMQAAGLVNDHLTTCPRHRALHAPF